MSAIRPQSLKGFVGQKEAVDILQIAISSCQQRNEALPHILLNGGPGLGKTSLANAIANDLNVPIQIANGGALGGIKAILPYLMKIPELGPNSILFIDEVHRIPTKLEEFLYPVMEDFTVCISNELEMFEDLPPFTLLAATTEAGSISQPLYDRFKYKIPLRYYEDSDMELIIQEFAEKIDLRLDLDAVKKVAKISRGTPRVAIGYTEWIRDFCLSQNIQSATKEVVETSLAILNVDEEGLTEDDRLYLEKLDFIQNKVDKGRPVGIKRLSTALSMSEETLINRVEPYLVRLGKIYKGSEGRSIIKRKPEVKTA